MIPVSRTKSVGAPFGVPGNRSGTGHASPTGTLAYVVRQARHVVERACQIETDNTRSRHSPRRWGMSWPLELLAQTHTHFIDLKASLQLEQHTLPQHVAIDQHQTNLSTGRGVHWSRRSYALLSSGGLPVYFCRRPSPAEAGTFRFAALSL